MGIPLPRIMRYWREQAFERRVTPPVERAALRLWAFVARRPALYRLAARLAIGLLGLLGRRRGRFSSMPLAGGWTRERDLPAPEGRTFQDMWAARRGVGRRR